MPSAQVAARHDRNCHIPQAADVMTPPGSNHTIDAHSQPLEETDCGTVHSPSDHHDLGGVHLQQIPVPNARDLQTARDEHDEDSSRIRGSSVKDVYCSLLTPALIGDNERQRSYNFTFPSMSSIGNEAASSMSAVRLNPAVYAREVVSRNDPKTAKELMKFFIDKVAPWVCDDSVEQWSVSLT